MTYFELWLCIILGAIIGSTVVLSAYFLGRKSVPRRKPYIPTELEIRSFIMAKCLLSDVHEQALNANKKELYSVDGSRYYETYEIPFCVAAIEKLIEKTEVR